MNYNQINEAIIKVPEELLSKVNVYVSSVLAYKLQKFSERFSMLNNENTPEHEKQKIQNDIKQTIGKLQQKFGAKNISTATFSQLDGKNIRLDLDYDRFFNELNYKGITPEMVEQVKNNAKFELFIVGGSSEAAGSITNDGKIVRLMVHTGRLNGRNSLNTANAIMRTVYHECQHVVQDFAIKTIQNNKNPNKTNKQLDRGDNYGDAAQGYYTSGIEYTPQLGDVINTINDILERDSIGGVLDKKMNRAINNALVDAFQEDKTIRDFLGYQRKHNPDGYQKALKAIYSKVAPVYKQLQQNGVDYRYSDLEPEVLEANINVLATALQMMRKKSEKFTINGRQKGDDIQWLSLESKNSNWEVIVAPKSNGEYQVTFKHGNYDEMETLDSQSLLNFIGIITENTYFDADDVLTTFDSYVDKGKDLTEQNLLNIKERILNYAEFMKVPFDDEAGAEFSIAGLPLGLYLDEDNKDRLIVKDPGEELYFVLPPMKVINLLQSFVQGSVNNPNEAREVLLDFSSYIEKINKLRNI
jgi:hypothetical protein